MTRIVALLAVGLACSGCAGSQDQSADQAAPLAGCIADGSGFLHARLGGAVAAEIDWNNTDMECDGRPRPDGQGIRLTFAGPLPAAADSGAAPRQLRFIFGVDEHDVAAGAAQALPTNLTIIIEGEQQLFATRGSGHCAVESLERSPVEGTDGRKVRVHARGYCLGPATQVAGDARVLVPTFDFTGIADTELEP